MLFLLDTSMTLTNSIAAVQTVRLNCWLIYWLSANLSCVVAVCPDVSTKLGTCNYSNQWKLTRVKLCEVKSHRLGLIYQNTSMICIKTVIFQLQRNQMCLQCVWIAWFCPLKKKNRIGMLSNSNTEVEWTQLKQVRNRMKAKTLTHIAAIRLQLGHDVRGRSCVYEAWITRVRPYSRGAARPHLMCTVTPSVTWSISNCCPL